MVKSATILALAQLRDIHLPDVSWWPLAPGWYGLILLLMMGSGLGVWGWYYYLRGHAKRQALRLLAQYQYLYHQDKNIQRCSQQISILLRRVALAYYPRVAVASLHGEDWIAFLNHTSSKPARTALDFNLVRNELLLLPYCPIKMHDQAPLTADLSLLFSFAQRWIKRRGGICLN